MQLAPVAFTSRTAGAHTLYTIIISIIHINLDPFIHINMDDHDHQLDRDHHHDNRGVDDHQQGVLFDTFWSKSNREVDPPVKLSIKIQKLDLI